MLEKYKATKHLQASGFAEYAVAELLQDQSAAVLLNRIADRAIINSYLYGLYEAFSKKNVPDFLDCFTESSSLYVVFTHGKGTGVLQCIHENHWNAYHKKILLHQIIYRFLDYYNAPPLIRYSILNSQNILMDGDAIVFHFLLDAHGNLNLGEKDIFSALGSLMTEIFAEAEIQKDSKLAIIIEKCKKAVYMSVGEVIRDLDASAGIQRDDMTIQKAIQAQKEKTAALAKRCAAMVGIIAVPLVVYALYKGQQEKELTPDVPAIGTVDVLPVEDEQVVIEVFANLDAEEEQPEPEPPPIPPEEKEEPAEEPPPADVLYTIVVGDNLSQICKNHYGHVAYVQAVAQYNAIENADLIYAGHTLKLPDKAVLEKG